MIIQAPPSKSYAVRAVIARALAGGGSVIGAGESDDVRAATAAAEAFVGGCERIDVGESALAANIFAALAGLRKISTELTGRGSLLRRMSLPLRVAGGLTSDEFTVDGSAGSQKITGLLMALPLAAGDSVVRVQNPASIPYIYMTLAVLRDFGIRVEQRGWDFFVPGGQKYTHCDYVVEGDWSGAAYFLVARAMGFDVRVEGLKEDSLQADRAVIQAITAAGESLRAFDFDATDCPDLFPALVALAAACEGVSTLRGARRLLNKESSRGEVLRDEYEKLGISVRLEEDIIHVTGGVPHGATVSSHGDHRIAMSLAISALRTKDKVIIEDPVAVNKSYPEFWNDYERIRK